MDTRKRNFVYVATVLIILFVLLSGMCVIQSAISNKTIEKVDYSISKQVNNELMDVVNVHINNNMDSNLTISKIKKLKDFADNSYSLFELTPIGYVIYHDDSGRVVEYSDESISPYINFDNDLYYIGGMQYYYLENGNYIHTLKDIKLDTLDTIYLYEESIRVNKSLMSMKNDSVLNYLDRKTTNFDKNEIIEIQPYASQPMMKMADFYTRLTNREQMGYRPGGVCGYIALNLIIGYNCIAYDNNIAPNTLVDKYAKCLVGPNLTNRLIECDGLSIDQDKYKGTIATDMNKILDNYFKCSDVGNSVPWKWQSYLFDIDAKKNIEKGYPVILFGNLKAPSTNEKVNHAVVAYGANKIGLFGVRYRVHFGWEGYASVYLDSPLIGSSFCMQRNIK